MFGEPALAIAPLVTADVSLPGRLGDDPGGGGRGSRVTGGSVTWMTPLGRLGTFVDSQTHVSTRPEGCESDCPLFLGDCIYGA
jgi:hypothetical protein